MNTQQHIIRKGESFVTDARHASIEVRDMKDDIVIACHNASKRRSGLCHASDKASIQNFLGNMLMNHEGAPKGTLQVRLLGGTDSSESRCQLEEIILALESFDTKRDILNIISADVLHKPHPDSFSMTTDDGTIQ